MRVLFVQGANPAVMNPAQAKVLAGLQRDDLFTVVHDQVLTDTARFADVVLPATTHFEVDDVSVPYGAYVAQPSRRSSTASVRAAPTTRSLRGWPSASASTPGRAGPSIRRSSGCAVSCCRRGCPTTWRRAPAASAVQFRDVWPSPDRRARLVADLPPATAAGAGRPWGGVARVPQYATLDSRLPLALLTPATASTINSIFGEASVDRAGRAAGGDQPDPRRAAIHLNPHDAAERGLVDGQRVRVSDGRAELVTSLVVDDDLRPGVASMPKGLWRDALGGGYTANVFAPDALSDLAGGATFNDARVEVSAL